MKILQPVSPAVGTFTRASIGTFVGSNGLIQTAPVNKLRFNYDPANISAAPVELREAAARNWLSFSENTAGSFGPSPAQAAWFAVGATGLTQAQGVAPDGANTASRLTEAASGSSTGEIITGQGDPNPGLPPYGFICYSLYVKPSGRDWVNMSLSNYAGTAIIRAYFNITTGVAGVVTTTNPDVPGTSTITPAGNGWYRIAVSVPQNETTIFWNMYIATALADGIRLTTGDPSKSLLFWGGQYESGTVPTSYIRTDTTAVGDRAADVTTSELMSNVPETFDDPQWVANKIYIIGERVTGIAANAAPKSYESLKGSQATATLSTANPTVVTWPSHGGTTNDRVSFTSSGTLPVEVVAGQVYFITVINANTFNISATLGGTFIGVSAGYSGTITGRMTGAAYYNAAPTTSATAWLDRGATNRWRMFDTSVQSQTTSPGTLDVTVNLPNFINTVSLLNVALSTLRVRMYDSTGVVVYDNNQTLKSTAGIVNWYNYFFNPIRLPTDIILEDLPTYSNSKLRITATVPTGNVAIGACLYGFVRDISLLKKGAEKGAKVGIQDYSVKTQDAFGNYTIVQRSFSKRADYTVYVGNNEVDDIQNLLASYRSTPVLYIGSTQYASTMVYGFYKTFDIDIAYDDFSACSLQIEGLT